MFRKLLVLAFGMALGVGGAQAATAAPVMYADPAFAAEVTLVGHRHSRGHDAHEYRRGHRDARPRYRGRDHDRFRYGYHRGHDRGYRRSYRGRYPAYGRGNAYPRGDGYDARQNYLRDMYGK